MSSGLAASSLPGPARTRTRTALPMVAGIAAIAALVPARELWPAQLALLGLLLVVPGFALLRAVRVPPRAVAATPIYVPAASIVVLLAAGLAVDLIGPQIGVDAPLRTLPLLISVETLCAALVLIAAIPSPRPRDLRPRFALPRARDLWPVVLILASAAGAARLTTGHGPGLAIAATIVCFVVAAVAFVIAPRLTRTQIAILLYGVGLALVWSFSLRTGSVVGWDITSEYHVVQATQAAGVWHVSHPSDNYSALLSLTVLPAVLHGIAGVSDLALLKAVYPALWAIYPVIAFMIARRHLASRYALLAGLLILTPSAFLGDMPTFARQEIALLLFGALVALLLDTSVPRWPRLSLSVLLGVGVVVSHYSTAYFMIGALGVAVLLQFVVSLVRPVSRADVGFVCVLATLVAASFLWYGPITNAGGNVGGLSNALASNGVAVLRTDLLRGDPAPPAINAATYTREVVSAYAVELPTIMPLADAALPEYQLKDASTPQPPPRAPGLANSLTVLTHVLAPILVLVSVLAAMLLVVRRQTPAILRQLAYIAVGTVPLLVAVHISRTIAAQYGSDRVALQALLPLSIAVGWAAQQGVRRLHQQLLRSVAVGVITVALLVLVSNSSGLTGATLGSSTPINLASSGTQYEQLNITAPELASAQWLGSMTVSHSPVYADAFGSIRLFLESGNGVEVLGDLAPQVIDRHAWVYASARNIVDGRAESNAPNNNDDVTYQFPLAFLSDNFNTVYANGSSEVFHR